MYLINHTHIDTFMDETLEYLEQNESLNNLMLGIAYKVKNYPNYYSDVYMATVRKKEKLSLAAIMTPPQKLVIYSNKNECDKEIELLIKDILNRNINLPGVVGPKEITEGFCKIWRQFIDCNIKLEMNMRVYELREVNTDLIGRGTLRLANENDLEFVAGAMYQFEKDTGLNTSPDKDKSYETAKVRLPEGNIFIWEDEGKVVSIAAKTRPTKNGITVNFVYTPKSLRNKGYATSCVAALSQHLLDSGYKFCSLFTDLSNPTSNSIYMKIGYKPVGDFDGYVFLRD